jgi:hypothetical protein
VIELFGDSERMMDEWTDFYRENETTVRGKLRTNSDNKADTNIEQER